MTKEGKKKLIAAVIALIIAIAVSLITPPGELTVAAMRYLGIFIAMIIFMVFDVLPAHITMLLTLVALIVFQVCTQTDALASYGQSTVWFVVCVLGFAAAINQSGLLKRLAFFILKFFPETFQGQVLALTLTSTVITPFIPSGQAKTSILIPLAMTMGSEMGYDDHSKPMAGLFSAVYVPCTVAGAAFVTGSVAYSLICGYFETTYSFVGFLKVTGIWFVLFTILMYLFITFFYRPKTEGGQKKSSNTDTQKVKVAEQKLAELGPMTSKEKIAAAILIIVVLAWVTESIHGISTFCVAALGLTAMTIAGLFNTRDFMMKIAWPTIIIMGAIFTLSSQLSILGIGAWLGQVLSPIAAPLMTNKFLFFLVLCILIYALRYLIISQTAICAICFALFGSLAGSAGISMTIVMFVTYMCTSTWNLSFNNSGYLTAEAAADGRIAHKDVVSCNYAFCIINIICVLVSVLYWMAIGMC